MKLRNAVASLALPAPLAVVLFALWGVFTGVTSWSGVALGAVTAYLIARISYGLLRRRLDPNLNVMMALRFPLFALVLFGEIVKANWDVLKRVFAPTMPISPRITSFDSFLSSDVAKTTLANCITLTPGTVTVELDGSRFYVHCLAREHEEELLKGRMERLVAWLFAEGPPDSRRIR